MNDVSLAVSVSDEIPLFPEKANVPVPMGHGFPLQAPPELFVPSAGECTAASAAVQTGTPERASQSLEGGEILDAC